MLLGPAATAGELLKGAGATLSVAESSAGGLICAALLALPGASAYFAGGVVVYTRESRRLLLDIPDTALDGVPPSTEAYALMLARGVRDRFGTTWGLAETGATGPTGNRYGYPPGHACLAVAGPTEVAITLETGSADRVANMRAFAAAAIALLDRALRG
jgi:PncC family amidohydrolase